MKWFTNIWKTSKTKLVLTAISMLVNCFKGLGGEVRYF